MKQTTQGQRLPGQYLDTLAFFTCLVPARLYNGTELSKCMRWFVPAGIPIGILCTLAAFGILCLAQQAAAASAPYLAALAWLIGEILISRALHWDGLADLADALGSFTQGDTFWNVMKDSRLGTFGALALIAVFIGQLLTLAGHIGAGQWAVLLLAPAWARGAAAIPFCRVPPHNPHSLGGKMAPGGTPAIFRLTLLQEGILLGILGLCGASFAGICAAALCEGLLLVWICRKARNHGGISGDFAGAAIELSQLCLLLLCF